MNSEKLKNLIRNKANGDSNLSIQFYQLFYFERLLERISLSKYKNSIIIKGGFLLTSIIGEDDRTTKDMDATIKGIPLNQKEVEKLFKNIINIKINDGVNFEIESIKDIRLEDEYGGFRVLLRATLDSNRTFVAVELTTGDAITPSEVSYNYKSIFDDKIINVYSYNIETVIAEKFQTIISRGVLNTRLKDFYDMYKLMSMSNIIIDKNILNNAIRNTFERRNTKFDIEYFKEVVDSIKDDDYMIKLWNEYSKKNHYAKGIELNDTIDSVVKVIKILSKTL